MLGARNQAHVLCQSKKANKDLQLNASYDIVHKVGGANGLSADLHEFLITPEGTALMTMYQITPGDVTMLRDFDPMNPEDKNPNYIWDCVFQELSIETGDVIFEWRASEHFNMTETYRGIELGGTTADPFDWFHINSVEKDELGNYLISARYTHSITYIDGKTKETIWQIGGKNNHFMDLSGGNATNFAWQHDARFVPTDIFPNIYTPSATRPGFTTKLVSVFDNAAEDQHYHYGAELSRGLLLEVTYPTPGSRNPMSELSGLIGSEPGLAKRGFGADNQKKLETINRTDPNYTVRVVKSYENPLQIISSSQGSMQILPQERGEDSKVLVGYGLNAAWTEFDSNGTALCDVHFGANTSFERGDIQSYRAYKFAWTGRPETRPSVDITDDDAEVYVSWNGATDVVEWVLQCSDTGRVGETNWADVVLVPKHKFETAITIPEDVGDSRYLRVIALAENRRRLDFGTSATIDRGIVASYFPGLNSKLPETVAHMAPMKVFLVVVCNVSLIFVVYEAYRRYLVWRHGRPSSGPLLWRKPGPAYRFLGEA